MFSFIRKITLKGKLVSRQDWCLNKGIINICKDGDGPTQIKRPLCDVKKNDGNFVKYSVLPDEIRLFLRSIFNSMLQCAVGFRGSNSERRNQSFVYMAAVL